MSLVIIQVSAYSSVCLRFTSRYAYVPTFGRGTIRRFPGDVSKLKRLAARDYEDLLQCAIPVFEGLLPVRHNKIVLKTLFSCARVHAYCKLRQHTDRTLSRLYEAITMFGKDIRHFKRVTCKEYDTRDLTKQDGYTRKKRPAAQQAQGARPSKRTKTSNFELPQEESLLAAAAATDAAADAAAAIADAASVTTRGSKVGKKKEFSLSTLKFHVMGDYCRMIRLHGSCDSYSTQIVSPFILL